MEDLRLDVGELDESRANVTTRVERTKQLLGEAIDQLCLMYAEVSE
jgi:hypothetical protein